MSATEFVNSSTGLTLNVYSPTTSSTAAVDAANVPYSTMVNSGNGGYRLVVQSADHSLVRGDFGKARFSLDSNGLDGEWNVDFIVQERTNS